jgi:SAM-dependent methyltransferase
VADVRALVSRLLGWSEPREPAPSAQVWDAQYASDHWDYVAQLPELPRFGVLVGYLRHFAPGGSILDLGCGEGFLLRKLQPSDYARYVGVDFANAAIEKATRLGLPNATFVTADIDAYAPTDSFDALVFTESLCYLPDPLRTVARYAQHLSTRGILLVSMNVNFRGGVDIVRRLRERYSTLDEVRLTRGDRDRSWVCTVLSATPKR